jgi:hypothetical protein
MAQVSTPGPQATSTASSPGTIFAASTSLQKIGDRRGYNGDERFSLAGELILNLSGMSPLSVRIRFHDDQYGQFLFGR